MDNDTNRALHAAANMLSIAARDYCDPRFTDRYGDGPRFKEALELVNAVLYPKESKKENN